MTRLFLLLAFLSFPALAAKGPYESTHDLVVHCDVVSDVAASAAFYLEKRKTIEQTVKAVARETGVGEAYALPIVENTAAMLKAEPTKTNQVKPKMFARCMDGNI